MPLYTPHQGVVYAHPAYTAGDTLLGHLGNKDVSAQLTDTGQDFIETATWLFRYEDAAKLKMGDRILVAGSYWVVTSPVMVQDAVFLLKEARCYVEKVTEGGS